MKIHFVVFGTPVPQGSKNYFVVKLKTGKHRAVGVEANKEQKPWRQEVTKTAIEAAKESGGEIIPRGNAVAVKLDFFFARPESKPKRITRPTVKPDCDKLARLIFDSMTGVIFEDDSQVCDLIASKHYGTPERVEITVATNNEAFELQTETMELFA